MIQVNIEPDHPTGYAWTARDGESGPIIATGQHFADQDVAAEMVKRLFGSLEPVDVSVRRRNGTGRHEMIR